MIIAHRRHVFSSCFPMYKSMAIYICIYTYIYMRYVARAKDTKFDTVPTLYVHVQ